MQELVPHWIRLVIEHLKESWEQHLVPAAIVVGAMMGVVMLVMLVGGFVAVIGLAIAAALHSDVAALVAELVAGLGVFAAFLASVVVLQPLCFAQVDVTVRLLRGEKTATLDWAKVKRRAPAVIGAMALTMGATLAGAVFCYVPGLVVAGLLLPTLPILADTELGPVDAVKKAFSLTRAHPLEVVVCSLLSTFAIAVLSYVPFFGSLVGLTVFAVLSSVMYIDLEKRTALLPPPA